MKENQLIILEQLPIIKSNLEKLAVEINKAVKNATSLVVNEDTVKEVKQVRANLNKEFAELESQRKKVKQAIMAKYEEFEEIYKENVSNLYKQADAELKEKIDNVENQLKQEKYEELEFFARQHFEFNDIDDIVKFEDIGLNITLSSSMKSLKEQILAFIEKIVNDIKLIKMEEYSDEILYEYKKNHNFAESKILVVERHEAMKKLSEIAMDRAAQAAEKLNEFYENKVEEITAPKEVIEDDEILKVSFTIETTKQNIIELKNWLKERGIKYE